jgi:cytochrome P450
MFELASAKTWPCPWPMYKALRDRDPVHHVVPPEKPEHDYFVLSRHADVWAAARDHETFSSAQGLTVNYGELELIGLQDNPPMVTQDPPVHTEFRMLVARGFTPRQVEAVEPPVRKFVVERLERLLAGGGGDIVAELFKPLPSMVVAHYLGVPEEDRKQFDGWTEAIVAANTVEGLASALDSLGDAVGSMMAYFTELIERRRRDPGDDTISHLVAAGVGSAAGELDVTRRPPKILTFSHGAHHCLGAAAARMQSRVTLTELLSRCPDFEVDEEAIVWAGGSYVRRPLSVPFTATR